METSPSLLDLFVSFRNVRYTVQSHEDAVRSFFHNNIVASGLSELQFIEIMDRAHFKFSLPPLVCRVFALVTSKEVGIDIQACVNFNKHNADGYSMRLPRKHKNYLSRLLTLDADQSPLLAKALLDKCDELKTVGGDQGVASDQDVIKFLEWFGFRSTEYGDNNSKTCFAKLCGFALTRGSPKLIVVCLPCQSFPFYV
jgi:hypothetical protein